MFNTTFKLPLEGLGLPGRSPSPPNRYVEPLSPTVRPAPMEPHFNYPAVNHNIGFTVRPEAPFSAGLPGNGTPSTVAGAQQHKSRHHRTSSTIATLAEVALATSPSFRSSEDHGRHNAQSSVPPSTGNGGEPPHKRARSEILPTPLLSQFTPRPTTSYGDMNGSYGAAGRPAYISQASYESRVEEAALLLNFRTGGWPSSESKPLNLTHPAHQGVSMSAPNMTKVGNRVMSGTLAQAPALGPTGQRALLPPFSPEQLRIRTQPVDMPTPEQSTHHYPDTESKGEGIWAPHVSRSGIPATSADHKANARSPFALPPRDAVYGSRTSSTGGDDSRATSADYAAGDPLDHASLGKKRRGWPKGKPRGAGSRRSTTEKTSTRKSASRRKAADAKALVSSESDVFDSSDEPNVPRRKSFSHAGHAAEQHAANSAASAKRSVSVPPEVLMLVRPATTSTCTAATKGSARRTKDVEEITCAACAVERETTDHGGEAAQEAWISCNGCKNWFHTDCAGFKKAHEVRDVDKFFCPSCEPVHGKTTHVRKSARAHVSVDYAELQKGVLKTSEESMEHHYIQPIKDGTFKFDEEFFPRMRAELVTKEWMERGGFTEPVCIPAAWNNRPWGSRASQKSKVACGSTAGGDSTVSVDSHDDSMEIDAFTADQDLLDAMDFEYDALPNVGQDKLDMIMPQNLTVRKVCELVGPDTQLDVIDVKEQNSKNGKWNLKRWADYYEQDDDGDKPIRNVISLEVSQTKLGRLLRRPKVVRDIDLQDQVWPQKEVDAGKWPKVQFYCLMSVADSYTDFHIDFGGSSVYYHILQGKKTFFFIPPKPKYLKAYEEWNENPEQNFTFLGHITKECYRIDLGPGDTMLIPSGWIHAVWTPETSLVIGGNFLTRMSFRNQFKVHEIEKANRTPQKFRYPFFMRLMWYTAIQYLEKDPLPEEVSRLFLAGQQFERETPIWADFDGDLAKEDMREGAQNQRYYSEAEMEGLPDLVNYIFRSVMVVMGRVEGTSAEQAKRVNSSIPKGQGEPLDIAKSFALWVAWKRGNEDPPAWAHPDAVLPNKTEDGAAPPKKLSSRALKELERKEAIAANSLVAPDRQSVRVKNAVAAAAAAIVTPGGSGSGPVVATPDESAIPAPGPIANSSATPARAHSSSRDRSPHQYSTFSASEPMATASMQHFPMQSHLHQPQYLSTPKTSVLGPKRVACDACRKRRIRCKHKDLVTQIGGHDGNAAFNVSSSSPVWQATPSLANDGSAGGAAVPTAQMTSPTHEGSAEILNDTIQVTPMRASYSHNGQHFAGSPDSAPYTGPLPGTNAYVTANIPMTMNGVPIFGDAPKRGRTKACLECRKSKRRCIHDESGAVDPIKAAETPVPRGSAASRKRSSPDEESPSQARKVQRTTANIDDPQQRAAAIELHNAEVDAAMQQLSVALGGGYHQPHAQIQQSHEHNADGGDQSALSHISHEQQNHLPIDPSLAALYSDSNAQNIFASHGLPMTAPNASLNFELQSLEQIASECLDMNGGHGPQDEGFATQDVDASRPIALQPDTSAEDLSINGETVKPDGSVDSGISITAGDKSTPASSPQDVFKDEQNVTSTHNFVDEHQTHPPMLSPEVSKTMPVASPAIINALPLYKPPPPPSLSPELSKRQPHAPLNTDLFDLSPSRKRKQDPTDKPASEHPLSGSSAFAESPAVTQSADASDEKSLELARLLQQDDLGLRKRGN